MRQLRPTDVRASEPTAMERPVETKTDPLIDKPPAAELPDWSDTEVMPLIIMENSLVVEQPETTDGLLPIGSEILLPRSPEVTGFEDQDALSAPLSPNRLRKGHSQDMPAEGSIFDVSPDVPGFNMRPAGGRCAAYGDYAAPAVKLRQFQRSVLRSTNCVCSMPQYPGSGYTDDCANI